VPFVANPGELPFDEITSSSDSLDCSRQTLRAIKVQLKDAYNVHQFFDMSGQIDCIYFDSEWAVFNFGLLVLFVAVVVLCVSAYTS
jgi:hypothetical protein